MPVYVGQKVKAADSDDHTKSPIKRENGMDFPARDYAYVPDPSKPSTWKIRLTEAPGKVTKAQLGRAAAALSSGGFRGHKAQIPGTVLSAVKRRIKAEYHKLKVPDNQIPQSVKERSFMVWKDKATGQYRWLAIYSNNFRDNDNPPEIISEKSHKRFVDMVDLGIVDYPELWHWHEPGTVWGKADVVDYSDGFAVASGYVYEGHEKEAEVLAAMDDIGVSHGMPNALIRRDPNDPSIITFHVTTEISPLPRSRAANQLTDFIVLEENDMGIRKDKLGHMAALGLNLDELDERLAAEKKAAQDAGIQSKDKEEEKPVVEEKKEEDENKSNYATREEVAEILKEVIVGLQQQIGDLASEIKELKASDSEKVARMKEQTPTRSLRALLDMNPIGSNKAKIDGRSSLAKDGPEEQEPEVAELTGIPFLNSAINKSRAG